MISIGLNLGNDLTITDNGELTVKIDDFGILELREDGLYVGKPSEEQVEVIPETAVFSGSYSNKSASVTNSFHNVFNSNNENGDGITGDIFPGDFYRTKVGDKYKYYLVTSVEFDDNNNRIFTHSFLKEV